MSCATTHPEVEAWSLNSWNAREVSPEESFLNAGFWSVISSEKTIQKVSYFGI